MRYELPNELKSKINKVNSHTGFVKSILWPYILSALLLNPWFSQSCD